MAIKLKVQETKVKLKVYGNDSATIKASDGIPIYPNPYEGETEFTPSADEQVIPTAGFMMHENITINPIPSNYGLITWNGSTLTVS